MMSNERLNPNDLVVREVRLGRSIVVDPPAALQWQMSSGKITLNVPVQSRLEIFESGLWRVLHDGRKWNRYGAQSGSSSLQWSFEYPSKFRLQFEGKVWLLGPQNEKLLYAKGESGKLSGREWRLLGASLGGHIAVIAAILGIISIPAIKDSMDATVKTKAVEVKKEQAKNGGGGVSARPQSRPFEGMSYAKFLNLLAAKEFAADPAAVLMKSVKKSTSAGDAPKVAQVGSALGKVDGAVDSGGNSLSGQLAREKFMVADSPAKSGASGGSAKISDKQLAQLKAKFRDLQSDFQRLYSRILVSDPSLSVTVSLELLVQSSGYLSVASFKARGTHRPDSLEKLKRGMTEIIQSAFVGQEFAGISLRGENVFVR